VKLYRSAPPATSSVPKPRPYVLKRFVAADGADEPVFWFTPDSSFLKFVTRTGPIAKVTFNLAFFLAFVSLIHSCVFCMICL
jgi:hypothetical protein